MSIIGVIPARWQSCRFPGKPLANILGKSLIQWTYENSIKSRLLDRLVVATDDQRIYDHVEEFGGEVFMTSKECPSGTDRIAELMEKQFFEAEIVVNIQGDEPCLNPSFIEQLVKKMQDTSEAVLTTLLAKLHSHSDVFNPNVVKCVFDKQQRALYFSRAPIPFSATHVDCDHYRHLGVYCFRRDFLLKFRQLEPSPLQKTEDLEQLKVLESGYPIHCCLVEDQTIGVDTPDDLKKIETILCRANTSSSPAVLSPL
ncbi:MAG: 3-deoxy-manno-octulosonate cytidylyltransferase [Chlamydiales bacterium]